VDLPTSSTPTLLWPTAAVAASLTLGALAVPIHMLCLVRAVASTWQAIAGEREKHTGMV